MLRTEAVDVHNRLVERFNDFYRNHGAEKFGRIIRLARQLSRGDQLARGFVAADFDSAFRQGVPNVRQKRLGNVAMHQK